MNEILVVVSRDEILSRIRGEFLEMPGLCLTHAQAQRLWGLNAQTCAWALAALTGEHFLHLRCDGSYGRLPECSAALPSGPRNSPHRAAENFRSAH
jgi:hypothetical protein